MLSWVLSDVKACWPLALCSSSAQIPDLAPPWRRLKSLLLLFRGPCKLRQSSKCKINRNPGKPGTSGAEERGLEGRQMGRGLDLHPTSPWCHCISSSCPCFPWIFPPEAQKDFRVSRSKGPRPPSLPSQSHKYCVGAGMCSGLCGR